MDARDNMIAGHGEHFSRDIVEGRNYTRPTAAEMGRPTSPSEPAMSRTLSELERQVDMLAKRLSAVIDRHEMLAERLRPVRVIIPRPERDHRTQPSEAFEQGPCSPVSDHVREQSRRLGSLAEQLTSFEGRIGDLMGELEL